MGTEAHREKRKITKEYIMITEHDAQQQARRLADKSDAWLLSNGFAKVDTSDFPKCPRCGKSPRAFLKGIETGVVRCCVLDTVIVSRDTEEEPLTHFVLDLRWSHLCLRIADLTWLTRFC